MAIKNIAVTDTLETFRTTFNDLAADDFGDIALLSGSISATNLVDAMNETISIATSTAGFTIADDTSTTQIIGGGDTLTARGTANQIQTVVSVPDTITFSLTNDVTISNNLTIGNNVTASGSTHTLGTIEISGNTLRSTDSTRINVNDTFRANAFDTQFGNLVIDELLGGDATYYPRIRSTRTDKVVVFDASPVFNSTIVFEGSVADDFETLITVINPTADRSITVPDITGTIITTGDTGTITSTMIENGTISTDDIADDQISEAKIADDAVGQDQLKSVVTLQILNSSGGVLKTLYGAGA
jgi:hypothetical protein